VFIFINMKSSIRNKILNLNVSGLLLCALFVGGFGIICANNFVKENARERLELISQRESTRITAQFENVEQYVKTLTYVVLDGLDSFDILVDSSTQEQFTRQNLNFMRATIRNVSNAVAVYLRYNPLFTPPTSGVFMAKTSKKSGIQKQVPTDFSKYEPEDIEHVGWYYVPIRSGKPLWMDPYENKNIDVYMISYVVPLFKFGKEVGVVGVDVDFNYLIQKISEIKLFETGFAYLERNDGKIAYHPNLAVGSVAPESGDVVLEKTLLPNGMRLVLQVPKSEINKTRDVLIIKIVSFSLFILALFILISFRIARSITRPLSTLNAAAKQMTAGFLDVKFDTDSPDEIGELGKSFASARDYMKGYLDYVKGVAFKDALTSVRNRSAFDSYMKDLQKKVDQYVITEYGLVMFDVNYLKRVNDNYGHEKGNKLLINACQIICHVFEHSPVFRVGGDEFVAVLQYEDYRNRESLLKELTKRMKDSQVQNDNPWERISIAFGMTEFNSIAKENYMDVLKRADQFMYEQKRLTESSRS